jgi:hypothetical protein
LRWKIDECTHFSGRMAIGGTESVHAGHFDRGVIERQGNEPSGANFAIDQKRGLINQTLSGHRRCNEGVSVVGDAVL